MSTESQENTQKNNEKDKISNSRKDDEKVLLSNLTKRELAEAIRVTQEKLNLLNPVLAKINSTNFNNTLENYYKLNNANFYGGENIEKVFAKDTFVEQLKLNDEINKLKHKLIQEVSDNKKTKEELEKLREEINSKEKINHILPRIHSDAQNVLLKSEKFKQLFEDGKDCDCVVVSIDIRRSTELMLKARTPKQFSTFITELSRLLSIAIMANYGIFDKFTGDGILAFFPKFYSGKDAIIRAIKASIDCHQIFSKHYNSSRSCFNVFIKDVGLGIGIDFGNVSLVNTGSELTVVGIPVVYACRLSNANAGDSLLNQPALEELEKVCKNLINVEETEISIKNEGNALAYKVLINESAFNLEAPIWET